MLDQLSSCFSPDLLAVGALEAARRLLEAARRLSRSALSSSPNTENLSAPIHGIDLGNLSAAINAIDLAAHKLEVPLLVDVHVSVDLARSVLLDVLDLHPVLVANVGPHLTVALGELDQAAAKLARAEPPRDPGTNRPA